jgi:hypothetical protein
MFSLCVCDEKGATVKQLGAGALAGWSAAALRLWPTALAPGSRDEVLDCLSLQQEQARLATSGGGAGRSCGCDG